MSQEECLQRRPRYGAINITRLFLGAQTKTGVIKGIIRVWGHKVLKLNLLETKRATL